VIDRLYDLFVAAPGVIADVATSRFGATAGILIGAAVVLIAANAITITARERRADRRARRNHREHS